MKMKLYIDDLRPCPKGYVLARNYQEAIDLLEVYTFEEISFDHDLGDSLSLIREKTGYALIPEKTGYDILCWIEQHVFNLESTRFENTVFRVHSANPVGKARMLQVIESIRRLLKEGRIACQ
jgi:hypothetical protein